MVIIAACSSSAHLLDLLSDRYSLLVINLLPYCQPVARPAERYSASKARLSGPSVRNARGNVRRRRASSRHARLGCRYAPRPGSRACGSGRMSSPAATRRSRLDLTARSLQPTQVRVTGMPADRLPARCSVRTVIPLTSLPRPRTPGTGADHAPGAGPQAGSTSEAAPAGAEPTADSGLASDLMSIRHPVSRAASRTFCPSLPMARENW
jgi:hypothetical protein